VAHREFIAPDGERWEAWAVQPLLFERRVAPSPAPSGTERRSNPGRRAPVATELRAGWLVFQKGESKRRLAPVPEGWDTMPDAELSRLLKRATPVSNNLSLASSSFNSQESTAET
jgi:hypothetical protein